MNNASFFKFFVFAVFSSILFSCSNTANVGTNILPDPEIQAGTAKVSGKIINFSLEEGKAKPVVYLRVSCPVSVDNYIIETELDENGNFFLEVPIDCSTVLSMISITGYGGVAIELSSREDIKVELKLDNSNRFTLENATGQSLLTNKDKENYSDAIFRYSALYEQPNVLQVCEMTPEEYVNYEMNVMQTRVHFAMKDVKFSDMGRKIILNDLQLMHLSGVLLSYKSRVEMICQNKENWSPQEPDIQYYSFLKSFDLNNPKYLYNLFFPNVVQSLLSIKVLNIPAISEIPVEEWLNSVKATLSDLVGFDSGQFYAILAANAYFKQFKEEANPLSEKQISNIKEYFKDEKEGIAKILFRKNEEIIALSTHKEPLVVNETPFVSKEKLMDAIISKYKGKNVIVDFWATWCSPCLDAMKKYAAIKGEIQNKNVVFVYITNASSPQELWKQKIKSIGGEHYYLNAAEWEYLMDNFGFEGIPSYVIFDTKGKIHNKFTAYPGNAELLAMIDKLLTK